MMPFREFYIDDQWKVQYVCSEFKPDGWFPGQPTKFAVHATAQLQQPAQHATNWMPAAMLRYPQEGFAAVFDNDREGHDAAVAELTARARAFKKP